MNTADLAFESFMAERGNRELAAAMVKGMPSGYRKLLVLAFTRGMITGMNQVGRPPQAGREMILPPNGEPPVQP